MLPVDPILETPRDLRLTLEVRIVKTRRRTCPRCRRIRVLYGLAANNTVQAGTELLCRECAGFDR